MKSAEPIQERVILRGKTWKSAEAKVEDSHLVWAVPTDQSVTIIFKFLI